MGFFGICLPLTHNKTLLHLFIIQIFIVIYKIIHPRAVHTKLHFFFYNY